MSKRFIIKIEQKNRKPKQCTGRLETRAVPTAQYSNRDKWRLYATLKVQRCQMHKIVPEFMSRTSRGGPELDITGTGYDSRKYHPSKLFEKTPHQIKGIVHPCQGQGFQVPPWQEEWMKLHALPHKNLNFSSVVPVLQFFNVKSVDQAMTTSLDWAYLAPSLDNLTHHISNIFVTPSDQSYSAIYFHPTSNSCCFMDMSNQSSGIHTTSVLSLSEVVHLIIHL
ncbi:hypothetical protein OG21DRAFT_1525088 [Imleria badia]|nr:hypothetical protein OG21DRAFT_1525088 [Imleria badia]